MLVALVRGPAMVAAPMRGSAEPTTRVAWIKAEGEMKDMDLLGDHVARKLESWGEVMSTDAALTDEFERLQGAVGLLLDLSRNVDAITPRYMPDIQEELVFKIRFLAEGINEALRRARRLTLDMVETLEHSPVFREHGGEPSSAGSSETGA